jgi:uncharacterized protein (TIGR00251 family)
MSYLQIRPDGALLLSLYVQPRASRNELAGRHGDALKLRLTSPPVDGKANKAVIAFLAKLFKVPKSAIVITSGLQSRSKKVLLSGLDEQAVRSLLSGKS